MNNNNIDFFGIRKKPKRMVSGPFSFLGKPTSVARVPSTNVRFLGGTVNRVPNPRPFISFPDKKKFTSIPNIKLGWGTPLYRKESILQKRLGKWGDADMDGSLNAFDCDPRIFSKDVYKRKVGTGAYVRVGGAGKKGNKKVVMRADSDNANKNQELTMMKQFTKALTNLAKKREAKVEGERPGRKRLPKEVKEERARARYEAKRLSVATGVKGIKGLRQRFQRISAMPEEYEDYQTKVAVREAAVKDAESDLARIQEELALKTQRLEAPGRKSKRLKEQLKKAIKTDKDLMKEAEENIKSIKAFKIEGVPKAEEISIMRPIKAAKEIGKRVSIQFKSPELKRLEAEREEKLKEGKEITLKEIQKIEELRSQEEKHPYKLIAKQVKAGATAKTGYQLASALGMKVELDKFGEKRAYFIPVGKGGEYTEAAKAKSKRVKRIVTKGLGTVFGPSLLQERFGPAIRGRPRGPSGKYMIEGKPVFEEEYQKWAMEQRAKNRILPSVQQQSPLTQSQAIPGSMPEQEQPMPQLTDEELAQLTPEEQQMMSEQMQIKEGEHSAIGLASPVERPQQVQRGPSIEEIKEAQHVLQYQDNILKAPNIMRGELHATGGSLLTPTGPQIMDAPNPFKGELRKMGTQKGDTSEVKLGERPQTNPYGDEYIDIELGSNRPVLKRRPREKWMTGEAL